MFFFQIKLVRTSTSEWRLLNINVTCGERPPCVSCEEFLRNICPEWSQVGYTIMEWEPYDNYNGAPKVRKAGDELWNAYCAYKFDPYNRY
ncbi:unnamed protein product [Trichogramma brassicae]|uniref:Uncharacterized protein n=1 Tax=Trichogramma brassicae TaxID=86971 RepID=A0A6H5IJN9_9HYME|nr:unnamed protein product [Trichogramma brassicae]